MFLKHTEKKTIAAPFVVADLLIFIWRDRVHFLESRFLPGQEATNFLRCQAKIKKNEVATRTSK